MFINSDPEMVLLMKKFLVDILKVDPKDLSCTIQINHVHCSRVESVLHFWTDFLSLNEGQFTKTYFVKTRSKKIYSNHDTYYGTLRLRVKRSTNMKYLMLGLIEAVKSVKLSR